jgi:hypothetical protein
MLLVPELLAGKFLSYFFNTVESKQKETARKLLWPHKVHSEVLKKKLSGMKTLPDIWHLVPILSLILRMSLTKLNVCCTWLYLGSCLLLYSCAACGGLSIPIKDKFFTCRLIFITSRSDY